MYETGSLFLYSAGEYSSRLQEFVPYNIVVSFRGDHQHVAFEQLIIAAIFVLLQSETP